MAIIVTRTQDGALVMTNRTEGVSAVNTASNVDGYPAIPARLITPLFKEARNKLPDFQGKMFNGPYWGSSGHLEATTGNVAFDSDPNGLFHNPTNSHYCIAVGNQSAIHTGFVYFLDLQKGNIYYRERGGDHIQTYQYQPGSKEYIAFFDGMIGALKTVAGNANPEINNLVSFMKKNFKYVFPVIPRAELMKNMTMHSFWPHNFIISERAPHTTSFTTGKKMESDPNHPIYNPTTNTADPAKTHYCCVVGETNSDQFRNLFFDLKTGTIYVRTGKLSVNPKDPHTTIRIDKNDPAYNDYKREILVKLSNLRRVYPVAQELINFIRGVNMQDVYTLLLFTPYSLR
ncbi:MAG: hypothetical protein PHV30_03110 [Candidatus Margulisbacteria bacterium]|nr:hypothetical protein [Candidatus Margulisiibacteriota bacterium]